nr:unnamed protein product [Callosobruchus analis]
MTLLEKLSLAAVIILTFVIAYTWNSPGGDVQTKWGRTYRKLVRKATYLCYSFQHIYRDTRI